MNHYIGREDQICGVELHRLIGGKGDGMRLAQVRNGLGLEFTVSPDRCADISRLTFMGRNMGFFSPCGYVAPTYYDRDNFLRSFTAGFLTTCGLTTAGSPSVDQGESFGQHGSIANTPADYFSFHQDENEVILEAEVRDAAIFARRLLLRRKLVCSKKENVLRICDQVENYGVGEEPIMLLYHMNMGYPLLSEKSELYIPSCRVTPCTEKAARNLESRSALLPPQPNYEEECFFHEFETEGKAMLYNPDIDLGISITFPIGTLNQLCQWKMMGMQDYVLGLEPGNCAPLGRAETRARGLLQTLKPGENRKFEITVRLFDGKAAWEEAK